MSQNRPTKVSGVLIIREGAGLAEISCKSEDLSSGSGKRGRR